MFAKIKKNKNCYSIYLCDRKRVDGKVVSKDIKINTFGWHSLYEDDEEYDGLIEDIPSMLAKMLSISLKKYDFNLIEVVDKLVEVKKEYYTTYKQKCLECSKQYEQEKEDIRNKQLVEYDEFKKKFRTLHYNEIMQKYKEGYENGIVDGVLKSNELTNKCSVNSNSMVDDEKKLLKEAFKLLSHKYHPDKKGGDTEKMAMINNLKEKVL